MTLIRRTFHHIRSLFRALLALRHPHPLLQSGIAAAVCGFALFTFLFLLLPLIFAALCLLALVANVRNTNKAPPTRKAVIIDHEQS